MVYLS
jgi:transposase